MQINFHQSNDPYLSQWQEVDSLEKVGKLRTALAIVDNVYLKAKEDKQQLYLVKALMYKMKYISMLEEDSESINIALLKTEIANSIFPAKAILQASLANLYWRYYQANRWNIINKKQLAEKEATIESWSADQFHQQITDLYSSALNDVEALQAAEVQQFKALLFSTADSTYESARYRPSLYDLIAQQAIAYYLNTESSLTKPASQFELEATSALVDSESFVQTDYAYLDHRSPVYLSIRLFQQLVEFHLSKKQWYPLIDVELKRLRYVKEHAIGTDKDSLFVAALKQLHLLSEGHPSSADVAFAIAKYLQQQGKKYQPLMSDDFRWEKKQAKELCEKTQQTYPESRGGKNCSELIKELMRPELQLSVEEVNLPNKPFRALLNYQNLQQVWMEIIPYSHQMRQKNQHLRGAAMVEHLQKQKALHSWTDSLAASEDLQRHSVEMKLPELAAGSYMILLADNPEFEAKAGYALAMAYTQVTHISCFLREDVQMNIQGHVVARHTGRPLSDVKVSVYESGYSKQPRRHIQSLKTGPNGEFILKAKDAGRYLEIEMDDGEEHYQMNFNQSSPGRERPEQQISTRFFTDRKIYRPGQRVFFKGIVLEKKGDQHRIKIGHSSTVYFRDANRQEIGRVLVKSNEYGTFSGSFMAPTTSLRGRMYLIGEGGQTQIAVEAYKRPTFEVNFDSLERAFSLNDEVLIRGNAKTYTGQGIAGAKVSYRITRKAHFPFWGSSRWWIPQPPSTAQTLTTGELTCDEQGQFSIHFTAIPDRLLAPETQAIFTYTIEAEVTDITGESQRKTSHIRLGYVGLQASVEFPELLSKDRIPPALIQTKTLDGDALSTNCRIRLHSLHTPNRIFRPRRWAQPDQYLMSREEYYAYFPHDVYEKEDDYRTWSIDSLIWEGSLSTGNESQLQLAALSTAAAGKYRLELVCQDKKGTEIRLLTYFDLLEADTALSASYPRLFLDKPSHVRASPGDTIDYLIRSTEDELWVLLEIEKKGQLIEREYVRMSESLSRQIAIKEADRGGLRISMTLVKYNAFYQSSHRIDVPWDNKVLNVSWQRFRSSLLPGQKEEWQLKISDAQGEVVAAELLASMYDASLDAFSANDYSLALYPPNRFSRTWQGNQGFNLSRSAIIEQWARTKYLEPTRYDYIHGFGTDLGNMAFESFGGGVSMRNVQSMSAMPMVAKEYSEKNASLLADATTELASEENTIPLSPVIRKNFDETAFFFPHLQTNEAGEITLAFKMPEALTSWKFMALAHSKDLKIGIIKAEIITQKSFMLSANLPRFLRKGDQMKLSAKLSNLTDSLLVGRSSIRILDAFSMDDVSAQLGLPSDSQSFQLAPSKNQLLSWDIKVPEGLQAVIIQMTAQAGNESDGEEHLLPLMPDKILLTASQPLSVKAGEHKVISFAPLLKAGQSKSIEHQALSLELSSNPAWYAVQSLPYLMEYPYESTDQIFNKMYAQALASHIAQQSPAMRKVFEQWKQQAPQQSRNALLSQLEQNPALKTALISETPWLLQAQNQGERKKRLGLLFDLNHLANEWESSKQQLLKRQQENGALAWFPNMPESRYITQLIVAGFMHLQEVGVQQVAQAEIKSFIHRAIQYLDQEIAKDYEKLIKSKEDLDQDHLTHLQIQYLHLRSAYLASMKLPDTSQKAYAYFMQQGQKYWVNKNLYMRAMLALSLYRSGEQSLAQEMLEGIKELAIIDDEVGMYWKIDAAALYWYQASVETQALLIEAFQTISGDLEAVEKMKLWLLSQKQTQHWPSTRATVAACHALLLAGEQWLMQSELVKVQLGAEWVDPLKDQELYVEAGTAYIKKSWSKDQIKPEMGNIQLQRFSAGVSYGALFWQYFEELDQVEASDSSLQVEKKLYVETYSDEGPILSPLQSALQPGDKVMVHLIVKVGRDMEYVHLKDLRAAGLEPLEVFSQYQYENGLHVYKSTGDAATHFFFEHLPKGTWTFTYPLSAVHKGHYTSGIAQVQCLYAPEFVGHSKGGSIVVE